MINNPCCNVGSTEIYDKKGLPADTERRYGPGYEEVFLPAAAKMKPSAGASLKEVSEMDAWTRDVFKGTKQLNPMQSRVFQTAFHSSENMLVRGRKGGRVGLVDVPCTALLVAT